MATYNLNEVLKAKEAQNAGKKDSGEVKLDDVSRVKVLSPGRQVFKRFIRIVFPLSKGGFISGFMLIFVSIMKELDLIILIMTPKTSTLPYLAFQYQNQNCPQASNCVAIVMFSIVFLVYALANIFGDADLAKSMAG